MIQCIDEAIKLDEAQHRVARPKKSEIRERLAKLTTRERDVFDQLLKGKEPASSKVVARILDISYRTVEHHRSRIIEKMGVGTVVELRQGIIANANSELRPYVRFKITGCRF